LSREKAYILRKTWKNFGINPKTQNATERPKESQTTLEKKRKVKNERNNL
jgi:hypothetical protein